tara:strand:+ start:325 stop:612 length:288 start_codon:yes stop_codon:yes gene_type:complete
MTRYHQRNNERIPFTAEEEAKRDTEEQAHEDGKFDKAIRLLREKRNRFLAETDFYALSDVTMSEAITTYRQQLRDIPSGLSTVEEIEAVIYPIKP